jgi:DNA polymerase-3 subunit gamma/tau
MRIAIFLLEETMAYLALYRKWRPSTFEEVIGQDHVAIPLKRSLEENRLAHAYLFSGPRGTGKTSMARILAKAVNCLNPQGVNPCNACKNCEDINHGSSLDVYEIDAASNRGIDDIRLLRESVHSLPSSSRKKVYIIDEVHMLSKEAFNALLKTLEEPPEHVLFILATTDPQKVPVTILSRCQTYEFHRISEKDISRHLLDIAEKSGFTLSEEAADIIAFRANGGLRDALSLLDKCLGSTEGKDISTSMVYDLLGLAGRDDLLALAGHVLDHKKGEVLEDFYHLLREGKEVDQILSELLQYFRALLIAKAAPQSEQLLTYGKDLPAIKETASRLDEEYLDTLFTTLESTCAEARRALSPREVAETGLLRLSRLTSPSSWMSLSRRVKELEERLARLEQGRPAMAAAPAPSAPPSRPAPSPVPSPSPSQAPARSHAAPPKVEQPATQPAPRREERKAPVPQPAPAPSAPSPAPAPAPAASAGAAPQDESVLPPASYGGVWKSVLDYVMSIPRIDVYSCFQKGQLIYAGGARAVISVPQQFLVLAGNNKSYQKVLSEGFAKVTGHAYTPKTVLKGTADEEEALSLARNASAAPAPASAGSVKEETSTQDKYKKISKEDIPEEDRNSKVLSEALKIVSDCDIYEKIEN